MSNAQETKRKASLYNLFDANDEMEVACRNTDIMWDTDWSSGLTEVHPTADQEKASGSAANAEVHPAADKEKASGSVANAEEETMWDSIVNFFAAPNRVEPVADSDTHIITNKTVGPFTFQVKSPIVAASPNARRRGFSCVTSKSGRSEVSDLPSPPQDLRPSFCAANNQTEDLSEDLPKIEDLSEELPAYPSYAKLIPAYPSYESVNFTSEAPWACLEDEEFDTKTIEPMTVLPTSDERVAAFLKTNGFSGVNDAKTTGYHYSYALHSAVHDNDAMMVEYLLQHGADRTIQDSRSRTPLQLAENMQRQQCILKLLCEN